MTPLRISNILAFALLLLLPGLGAAASAPAVTVQPPVTTGVSTPVRMAQDRNGYLYLSDPRSGGVLKFSSAGLLTATFPLSRPQGIVISDSGDMIVGQGDVVVVLNASGQEKFRLGKGAGQFKLANGIVTDAAGFIYVVDSLDNCVQVFTAAGAPVTIAGAAAGKPANSFGSSGTASGQLAMPTGIAYEKVSGQLAIADTNNGRIQFFDRTGSWKRTIGTAGVGELSFSSPVSVSFEYTRSSPAALARMYVADSFQSNVQVVDPAATPVWLGFIGSYGRSNGKLLTPADALFDPLAGRLLVANGFGNITVYGIDGGTPSKAGDCDGNGTVTIAEVQSAINMYLGLNAVAVCVDTDRSGAVSIAEVQKVINGYLGL